MGQKHDVDIVPLGQGQLKNPVLAGAGGHICSTLGTGRLRSLNNSIMLYKLRMPASTVGLRSLCF